MLRTQSRTASQGQVALSLSAPAAGPAVPAGPQRGEDVYTAEEDERLETMSQWPWSPWSPVTPPPREFVRSWIMAQRPFWPPGCHCNLGAAKVYWIIKSCLFRVGCPFGAGIHGLSRTAQCLVEEDLAAVQERAKARAEQRSVVCTAPWPAEDWFCHMHRGPREPLTPPLRVPVTPPGPPPKRLRLGEVDWIALRQRESQQQAREQDLDQMLEDGAQAEIAKEWEFWTTDADFEMRRRHVLLPRIQLQS